MRTRTHSSLALIAALASAAAVGACGNNRHIEGVTPVRIASPPLPAESSPSPTKVETTKAAETTKAPERPSAGAAPVSPPLEPSR